MSRSGYSDDCGNLALYRGTVINSVKGKRGKGLLTELAEAMDAMPVKELIAHKLEADGAHCALGVVGAKRGVDLQALDQDDPEQVAKAFNISQVLAREIVYRNDEDGPGYTGADETPAQRWARVRKWVQDVLDNPKNAY